MKYGTHWSISNEKKQEYINRLLPQLSSLRAKAGLSQDELSGLVGISRQTYCLTESGSRGMSWNTYLSVIMFFDYNVKTHDLIRRTGVFPEELIYHFNPEAENSAIEVSFSSEPKLNAMYDALDKDGKNTVKTAVATQYARCEELSKAELLQIVSEITE